MDVTIKTYEEINTLVQWTVCIPRSYITVKTKSFLVFRYKWNLKLEFKSDFEDSIEITLCSSDNKYPPSFLLTVYIRHKGRDVYMKTTEIFSQCTRIFDSNYTQLRKRFPDIQGCGLPLQFVFQFHAGTLNPETPIKGERSAQASNPNTGTKNLENFPCLQNLSLDLNKLVEGGTDTDVLLKCGDVSIGAHKLILGARSEVFRTMMQSDMVEGRQGIVEIVDMDPKLLKIFIRYIYTGILPELTVDTALPIYEAADKYQVEALKKRSSHLLVKNLSPENALVIFAAADAHSDSDLKDQLLSYISEKKIPTRKTEWLKFCNENPRLAVEVLNFMMYKVFLVNS